MTGFQPRSLNTQKLAEEKMKTQKFRPARLIAVFLLVGVIMALTSVVPAYADPPPPTSGVFSISTGGDILRNGEVLIPFGGSAFPLKVWSHDATTFTAAFSTCVSQTRWKYYVVFGLTPKGEPFTWNAGGWTRVGRCIPSRVQRA